MGLKKNPVGKVCPPTMQDPWLAEIESQPRRCWCDSLSLGLVWHAGMRKKKPSEMEVKTGECNNP